MTAKPKQGGVMEKRTVSDIIHDLLAELRDVPEARARRIRRLVWELEAKLKQGGVRES